MAVGETIEYPELNKLIGGGNVQSKHRYLLETAQRALLSEDRVVFGCVFGKGLKRLEANEIPAIGDHARGKINRISKRAARKLACADYAKLNNEQRLEWNTHMSLLGVIATVTKQQKVLQLKAAVSAVEERLPLNKTLELFKT